MTTIPPAPEVTGRECRFAVYCPPSDGGTDDLHVVKEIVHYADGTREANLRLVPNFQRDFWVTKKSHQNHQDKKEWEDIDKVSKFSCTQTALYDSAARALGEAWRSKGQPNIRKLNRSPYLYGTDIASTAIIKRAYQDKYPKLNTKYSVATFDTETNVFSEKGEIIIATLSFGNRVITAIDKNVLKGHTDVIPKLREKIQKYLSAVAGEDKDGNPTTVDFLEKRKFDWEIVIVDGQAEIVKRIFERAHEWKPDFIAVWNLSFDMKKVLAALDEAGIDPKDVFSDPSVPKQYRHFKYKEGSPQKVTASGKITPKRPEERWHTVYCPSSFYFIDAMCAYNFVRAGQAKETSYSLNAILTKHLNVRKLNFKEAEGVNGGLEWHMFMQENYILEYIVYNVFDCVSMEVLDETIKDLSMSLPLFSKCSDFQNFNSQPRRLVDDLHYFCLKNNRVIASTSDEMEVEFDDETAELKGWIITLAAHLVEDNGLCLIEEVPGLRTNIRGQVADLDVSASYPNGESVFNISKETTKRELIEIVGVSNADQRTQGINLSGGHVNAVEIATTLFGLPQLDDLLIAFEAKRVSQ